MLEHVAENFDLSRLGWAVLEALLHSHPDIALLSHKGMMLCIEDMSAGISDNPSVSMHTEGSLSLCHICASYSSKCQMMQKEHHLQV